MPHQSTVDLHLPGADLRLGDVLDPDVTGTVEPRRFHRTSCVNSWNSETSSRRCRGRGQDGAHVEHARPVVREGDGDGVGPAELDLPLAVDRDGPRGSATRLRYAGRQRRRPRRTLDRRDDAGRDRGEHGPARPGRRHPDHRRRRGRCRPPGCSSPAMLDSPIACGSANVQYSSRSVLRLPQRLRADVRTVDTQTSTSAISCARRPRRAAPSPVGALAGGDAAGGEQRGGRAGDRRLPHLREGVVGAGGQRQQRDVAAVGRRRPDGAVAAEQTITAAPARAWPGPGRGCRRAVPESTSSSTNSSAGSARRSPGAWPERGATPPATPIAVGGHEHPLDPGGARSGEQPQHHVGLLGVGEHRGLRDEPADVAAGHGVGDDADRRARDHRQLRPRDRAHTAIPPRRSAPHQGCSDVAAHARQAGVTPKAIPVWRMPQQLLR